MTGADPAAAAGGDGWALGPFTRHPGTVVAARSDLAWAAKDVFNPGGVVHDGRVHLLVRGEDAVGRYEGTSRIGLAVSDDGEHFTLEPEPVLGPGDDRWAPWEAGGGCEDPRVVEAPDGGFVCLYTGFDGKVGTLMVATSDDLRTWAKHGPAFAGTPAARRSSKAGAVVTEVRDGRLVAARLPDGHFWMHWGEGVAFAATSDDLVRWTPVTFDATGDRYLTHDPDGDGPGAWGVQRVRGVEALRPVLFPRPGRWDSMLVEPGPPSVRTADGIVLITNGANHPRRGDASLPPYAYAPGQVLLDAHDPASVLARATDPFLRPGADESGGQVGDVLFAQALVLHRDRWHLYLGLADSRIGLATAPARP